MMDILQAIDVSLLRFLNDGLANPVFDLLMPFLTDLNKQKIVLVLVAVIILWMLVKGDRSVRWAAVLLIVTIAVSDQLSSSVIKHWFERPRPCHMLANVRLLVDCGSGFSFPSSHAVNNFAGALVLAWFIPRGVWWFFGFAAVVAFSRIYVGVHYTLDILGGAVIGLACGGAVLVLFNALDRAWSRKDLRRSAQ